MIDGLGERLQKQRHSRRLSQAAVAAALHISPSVLSNYEHGERTPSIEVLITLASLYCCSTDYLLGIQKSTDRKVVDVSVLDDGQIELLQVLLYTLQKSSGSTRQNENHHKK